MKKNLVRIVALLLVAMLALTLIPLGALADETAEEGVSGAPMAIIGIYEAISGDTTPEPDDLGWDDINYDGLDVTFIDVTNKSATIKTSDYESHVIYEGELLDLKGLGIYSEYDWKHDKEIKTYASVNVPKFDNTEDWFEKWESGLDLIYTVHQHKLSCWYSDSTTHWRECLVCKHYSQFDEDFMFQNWHSDGDEDRICDVCGADIPYHEVRVIETEGGKITVNEVEAPHRRKIVANVEAAEGYKFKKLHFTKVRDDGSRQEITRRKSADGYWTYMPTYELEVSAEFVKK